MTLLDLNNPDTRQAAILDLLALGRPLIAADLSQELSVSTDTIRRDLIALENNGLLKRIAGGAMPISHPAPALHMRQPDIDPTALAKADILAPLVTSCSSILLDGGTSIQSCATIFARTYRGLVITPSPAIASLMLGAGVETVLLGGRLSPSGGISVGSNAERELSYLNADICFLGCCSLTIENGVGADNYDEASLKRKMVARSAKTIAVAGKQKFETIARHQIAPVDALGALITNTAKTADFSSLGIEIYHV